MSNLTEFLERLFKTSMDHRGRIYVPKCVRKKLMIGEGDRIYIIVENDHFKVYTAKALKLQIERKNTKSIKL